MATRFWRVVGLQPSGVVGIELSEIELWSDSSRLDQTASFAVTIAPVAGNAATLVDGTLTGAVLFSAGAVASPGFAFVWDFGSPVAVSGMRYAGESGARCITGYTLQCSADAQAWETVDSRSGLVYPGPEELSVWATDPDYAFVKALLPLSGVEGSTNFPDATGRIWTPSGGIVTTTSQWPEGAALMTSAATLATPYDAGMALLDKDFCIEFDLFLIAAGHAGDTWIRCWGGVDGSNSWIISDSFGANPVRRLTFAASPTGSYTPRAMRHFYGDGPESEIPLQVWQRLSVSRVDGVFYLAREGKILGKTSTGDQVAPLTTGNFSIYDAGQPVRVVAMGGSQSHQIKNVRITVGAGRHSSDYVAGTGAFPLIGGGSTAGPRFSMSGPVLSCPGPTQGAGAARGHAQQRTFMDAYHGGRGIIRATVKRKNTPENTPLLRRVDLMDERSRLVIRSTWSDPATGIYAFVGIREDLVYTVVSHDPSHDKRAVIADNMTLANGGVELMP